MLVKKLLQSLPQRAYSATEVLNNEHLVAEKQGIAMYDLMEAAGQACFGFIQRHYPWLKKLLVLSGMGNNGGDGFVIARLAQEAGIHVTVYLCAEQAQLKGDAKTAFETLVGTQATIICQHEGPIDNNVILDKEYQLIIDALFGIGFRGELPDSFLSMVHAINHSNLPVLSVDVPSGLEASTGFVSSAAIRASHTITFIALKQGLLTGKSADYVGELYLADLNLGDCFQQFIHSTVNVQELTDGREGGNLALPKRSPSSHKGHIGLLMTFGGSCGYPGAIRLASEAALRAGAALVSVCCHQENHPMVISGRPELMLMSSKIEQLNKNLQFSKAKAFVCGPGLGQNDWGKMVFDAVMTSKTWTVLDADALYFLAKYPRKKMHWILTPHPGEAATLLDCTVADIEADRFSAVRRITHRYGGICVLKGAGTLICDGHNIWVNTSGNSGMASGGMGDVLSGIIGALLMQHTSPIDAVRLAVYIHGKAADLVAKEQGKIGMLASDLFPQLQYLLNQETIE